MVYAILVDGIINIWGTSIGIPRYDTLTSKIYWSTRECGSIIKKHSIDRYRPVVTRSTIYCQGSINRTIARIARMYGITGKLWIICQSNIRTNRISGSPLEWIASSTINCNRIITRIINYLVVKGMGLKEGVLELISSTVSK